MEEDGFSRLPQELIHNILGFLDSTKEALKTSAVSKTFLAAWLSYRVLDFDEREFSNELVNISRYEDEEEADRINSNIKRFHKFVDDTMIRVSDCRIRLQSFKLRTTLVDSERGTPLIDKWIGIALDGHVQEISLDVRKSTNRRWHYRRRSREEDEKSRWWYSIPERVLSNKFLKSLTLVGEQLGIPFGAFVVDLISLQSLELIWMCFNEEETLQRLLKGCPGLENLTIESTGTETLSELKISHLNLKTLSVSSRDLVEVKAPRLEMFRFYYTDEDHTKIIVESLNLKCLDFESQSYISKEWFSEFLSKYPLLETLKLWLFRDVKKIKISNPAVKNIELTSLSNLVEVEIIDCSMLLSVYWIYNAYDSHILPYSLSVINHDQPNNNFTSHVSFIYSCHLCFNTPWFRSLREFLLKSCMVFRMTFFILSSAGGDIDEIPEADDDGSLLPPLAVAIEQLNLMVQAPESFYSSIMNGFLSACHPDTIYLSSPSIEGISKQRSNYNFAKFFREKIENRDDGDDCYCSDKIKCWKHQLKDVKIEEIRRVWNREHDSGDDDDITEALPSTLFKIQWY